MATPGWLSLEALDPSVNPPNIVSSQMGPFKTSLTYTNGKTGYTEKHSYTTKRNCYFYENGQQTNVYLTSDACSKVKAAKGCGITSILLALVPILLLTIQLCKGDKKSLLITGGVFAIFSGVLAIAAAGCMHKVDTTGVTSRSVGWSLLLCVLAGLALLIVSIVKFVRSCKLGPEDTGTSYSIRNDI